jgi:hypothetical protein
MNEMSTMGDKVHISKRVNIFVNSGQLRRRRDARNSVRIQPDEEEEEEL